MKPLPTEDEPAWYDYQSNAFELNGFPWHRRNQPLRRLPAEILEQTDNPGLKEFSRHTSGGMIRFKTDSRRIAIKIELSDHLLKDRMAMTGQSGIDLYLGSGADKRFFNGFRPDPACPNGYAGTLTLPECRGPNEITLYLPLLNGIDSMLIGLDHGSRILSPTPFAFARPIVFYGSSITQGAFASRPGNSYVAMLCRRLNAEPVNLGFCGSAKGEVRLAEAIASLELSLFVLDYDHNAPDPDHLAATHEKFFRTVRSIRPELPIVILSRPDFNDAAIDARRREIVRRTWCNAVADGDDRVIFIDGETLFGFDTFRDCCTVDTVHPNDLGFMRMADNLYPSVREILEKQRATPDTAYR